MLIYQPFCGEILRGYYVKAYPSVSARGVGAFDCDRADAWYFSRFISQSNYHRRFIHGVAQTISILGALFVGALKAIAPLLVFILIIAAISQHKSGTQVNVRSTLILYMAGTFLAALTAVVASFLFPTELILKAGEISQTPPSSLAEVIKHY